MTRVVALMFAVCSIIAPASALAGQQTGGSEAYEAWRRAYDDSRATVIRKFKLFIEAANDTDGFVRPLNQAKPHELSTFLFEYVSTGVTALNVMKDPGIIQQYSGPAAWAGRQYIRRHLSVWFTDRDLREKWQTVVGNVEKIYNKHLPVLSNDSARRTEVELLLEEYVASCAPSEVSSADFSARWRALVERYEELRQDTPPPRDFGQLMKQCKEKQ